MIVDEFVEQARTFHPTQSSESENLKAALQLVPAADHAAIEERAAIMEFDGEVPRDEAERAAIILTMPKAQPEGGVMKSMIEPL